MLNQYPQRHWVRSLIKQWYRYSQPKSMRHMEAVRPYMRSELNSDGQGYLTWLKKPIAWRLTNELLKSFFAADSKVILMATGPSVLNEELNGLHHQASIFGVNGAVSLSDKFDLKFCAHMIVDRAFVARRFDLVEKIFMAKTPLFLTYLCAYEICIRKPELLYQQPCFLIEDIDEMYAQPALEAKQRSQWLQTKPELVSDESSGQGFSLAPQQGIFDGATVTYWALQLIAAMTTQPIGIMGMDLQVDPSKPRCYNGDDDKSKINKDFEDKILPAFTFASSVIRKHNLTIYNLSPTSRLPQSIIAHKSLTEFLHIEG